MPSLAFVTGDFKVFDVEGFRPRMAELRSRVRPKLEVLGKSLAPAVSRSLGGEVFARVAQLVIARAVPAEEAARWSEAEYRAGALETFRALVPLYRLR